MEINTSTITSIEISKTTRTSTSTVPTPTAFTPLSLEPGYRPKFKGRDVLDLKAKAAAASGGVTYTLADGAKKPILSPQAHPRAIFCAKFVEPMNIRTVTINASSKSRKN